jgi:hypothetical protein
MRLTQHALEKCQLYGVGATELLEALQTGETLIDRNRGGSLIRVFSFQSRPWVAVLDPETDKVITVYPTDQITVESRRRSGRWMF